MGICLTIRASRLERQTYLTIFVRQIHNTLWQTGSLHNASNLQCAFLLDQLPYRVEQVRRELKGVSN